MRPTYNLIKKIAVVNSEEEVPHRMPGLRTWLKEKHDFQKEKQKWYYYYFSFKKSIK